MKLDLRELALRGGERFEDSFPLQMAPLVLGGVSHQVLVLGDVGVVVERVAGGFLISVGLKARVYGPCARCLEEATLEVDARQQEFVPTAEDGWEESALSAFVDDLVVDIDGIAREALVLSLPGQVLCSEECKGICPQCGQDLNQGLCECSEKETDERWNKLKDLKLED
jgi:DUF177 domain-containing protein